MGITRARKEAMNDDTVRDRKNYGDMDIAKTALPKFQEKMRVCGELFHCFDDSAFLRVESSDTVRADFITSGSV